MDCQLVGMFNNLTMVTFSVLLKFNLISFLAFSESLENYFKKIEQFRKIKLMKLSMQSEVSTYTKIAIS